MNFRGLLIVSTLLGSILVVLIGLGSTLTPLIISVGLAYLLFPLIKKIEHLGVPRHLTVMGVFLFLCLTTILVLVLAIPSLINDARSLLTELPQYTANFIDKIESLASSYGHGDRFNKESLKNYVVEHMSEITGTLMQGASNAFKGLFSNALRWFLTVLNFFLIPLFFFHVINDYEKLIDGLKSLMPRQYLPKIMHYFKISNDVLSGYIRGQLLVAMILGFLYGIGLSIVGLRFGFLIGFLSGMLSIIPYAGFTLGFATSLVISLSSHQGLGDIVAIVVVFLFVQALEGTVITPRLVGNKVGLNPLATMLALIIGGNLFGLVGMLIAIPFAAILKCVFIDLLDQYKNLEIYK